MKLSEPNIAQQMLNLVQKYDHTHLSRYQGAEIVCGIFGNKCEPMIYLSMGDEHRKLAWPMSSLTKHIVATWFLEKGVDIQNEVGSYLEKCPKNVSIKVSDLLNHTSGIKEYLFVPSEEELNSWTLDDCCDFIYKNLIGESRSFLYSNSNYVLLSKILEVVSGREFGIEIRDYLSDKGLIESSSFESLDSAQVKFFEIEGGMKQVEVDRCSMGWGDGSVWMSIDDCLRWSQSSEFKSLIKDCCNQALETQIDYINGVALSRDRNRKLVAVHSGSTQGSFALFIADPEAEKSFWMMGNHTLQDETLIDRLIEDFRSET